MLPLLGVATASTFLSLLRCLGRSFETADHKRPHRGAKKVNCNEQGPPIWAVAQFPFSFPQFSPQETQLPL